MKKVLFPVISDISSAMVPTVRNFAKSLEAEVHVLHVVRPTDEFIESRIKTEGQWLDTFVEKYMQELSVHKADIVPGDPADEIIKYAETKNVDLVILGTHGRKGLDRFYFGSVAENVVARSSVPVLTVNIDKAISGGKKK